MTIPDLIASVLQSIRESFYADKADRLYYRDEKALMREISRWGHECHKRGWDFQPHFILAELQRVLFRVYQHRDQIPYLPAYLGEAIRRSVGQRAEELAEQSRRTKITRAISVFFDGTEKVARVESVGVTETLSALYSDLRRKRSDPSVIQRTGQVQQALL